MTMKKPGYLTSIVLLVVILTGCATPIQISPTNAPMQTLISAKSMIRPGDKISEMSIVSESIFTHNWLVEFCEFDFETIVPTQTTDCTVTNLDTPALGMGLHMQILNYTSGFCHNRKK